nr:zinc finger, CCHC-type [Tanacetum cinerariifolium]
MNPDHYQLAKEEYEQLVSQGIIEPTTSPWACEAFYVNKRSEQSHAELLSKFYSLVTKYGIMLSEKKMEVGETTIRERKLQTLYTDTRGLIARANGVDPDKIPYHVMWNISIWSEDHPDAYKWIEVNGQWLYENFDHCEVETSYDDDDARSLWSSDEEEHFDPFEDDLTHLDARWSP